MDDLARMRSRKDEILACISSLEAGRVAAQARYTEYAGHIAAAKAVLAIGRRPEYDLEKLTEEYNRIAAGISDIDGVLTAEKEKLAAVEEGIAGSLAILKVHGVICQVGFGGEHDWQILEYMNEPGREKQWKRRICTRCPTEQRLGHER